MKKSFLDLVVDNNNKQIFDECILGPTSLSTVPIYLCRN